MVNWVVGVYLVCEVDKYIDFFVVFLFFLEFENCFGIGWLVWRFCYLKVYVLMVEDFMN